MLMIFLLIGYNIPKHTFLYNALIKRYISLLIYLSIIIEIDDRHIEILTIYTIFFTKNKKHFCSHSELRKY